MSDQYMKELLRVAVAQICQTIGYNATQTAPLELLQDVLDKFMREFTRDLRRQVEHYNRTEANLNDVTLTLRSINVNLNELLDYINNVEPVPFALEVPKFPAHKDSALNFLKPGSKEVLSRPVHVHDHLPPMLPPDISQPPETALANSSNILGDFKSFQDNLANNANINGDFTSDATSKSLNPAAVLDRTTLQSLFKPSNNLEDGERPTREVSSVVMTTGGYISPAVEGKMPEAIVPDIIDKLLGLDAPPPPAPPPPPPLPRPPSRSATSTPVATEGLIPVVEKKDLPEREVIPSTSKESKKSLARNFQPQAISNKKLEVFNDLQSKKNKLINPALGKCFPQDPQAHLPGNINKKSFMMHQNAANMLLKKAKKQKAPIMPGQPLLNEKLKKPPNEKVGKMDAADKAHKKYMKMLQKMAKQGKIPPELLNNIMGSDKKSKIINPAIVAGMPPGPEKLQLEKLLRKQAKQRQKMIKQQMMLEVQKKSKKALQQLPPLVPIFPPKTAETLNKPIVPLNLEEQKLKVEKKDLINILPVKPTFIPNIVTSTPAVDHVTEAFFAKSNKTSALNDIPPLDIMEATTKHLAPPDGKELKLSNEPDRSKLNIFKKISKQKTPKSASPTPIRVCGSGDTPIINLPSGTTITPTTGPSNPTSSSSALISAPVGRNLFPPLPENSVAANNNMINVDGIKDKLVVPQVNTNQPTDLSMLNRVFGEKPAEVELVNKPKKRGRKPGSKNSPKIPGVFPNSALKKNNKKMKLNNSNIFNPQIPPPQLTPEFAAVGMGNLPFDNVAHLFGNPLNPMEWAQNKHLQQQMMIMASAKERKEYKKKNKLLKQDLLNNDKNIAIMPSMTNTPPMNVPTSEEVQSINKKLMRMDTILKAAPPTGPPLTDLTIDTSLITGKKLPSPSVFPSSGSPLKSPGNTKRMMSARTDAMAAGLVQPFMMPGRPTFPNLPSNMLSMLQFPFPTRPGLIPTPGLFPTPGLGAFSNNPKNPLLPGLFPFPNLKQMTDNSSICQDSEDLTTAKKNIDMNLQAAERSYCNVAPLVPDFLAKLSNPNLNASMNKYSHDPPQAQQEPDLPKTPKPRSSHANTLSQDNLHKKIADAHTPESLAGSLSGKSIPSTPGGISLNTFEQLMKKSESPIDLMNLNKHSKPLSVSQESGLDFSMNKKPIHNTNVGNVAGGGISIKTPITLNNEPIEVSDDSDEANRPQIPPPEKRLTYHPSAVMSHTTSQQSLQASAHHNSFNVDDMFVANAAGSHLIPKSIETDLSSKELKKLKKQVKKSSSSINANLMVADKTEGLTTGPGSVGGVGKLAGGADLIPLTSTGLAYSAKNIPYNSLTANANPSFHAHKTDFSNTGTGSLTVAAASVFDNLTITAATPTSAGTPSNSIFDLQKKRKEHKKLKKLKELKEGKIKKKKDKKDKNKSKDKAEKYLHSQAQTLTPKEKEKEPLGAAEPMAIVPVFSAIGSSSGSEKVKEKDLLKKLKKEKKKEKQRIILEEVTPQNSNKPQQASVLNPSAHRENTSANSSKLTTSVDSEQPKKQKQSPALNFSASSCNEHNEASLVINTSTAPTASIIPKLTLKIGPTHSPTPPREDCYKNSTTSAPMTGSATVTTAALPQSSVTPPREREPSPELARISPLITRPPKHKLLNTGAELPTGSSTTSSSISAANASSLEIGESNKTSSTPNANMIVPPPSPWLSGGTISASSVLLPNQLLQTTKLDITAAPMTAAHSAESTIKAANADRQSPLTLITETSRPSSYIDAEGNRVWICPACGKVDDGSPMIGCDGCDAWYHWVCVGIFVAPKDNEDWFCRVCITRKKGIHGSDKKRKRNKKK